MRIGLARIELAAALAGASNGKHAAAWDGLIWFAVIVLAVVAGAVVLLWVRRRLHQGDDIAGPAFSLEDLRQLRERGELSDEEFQLLKQKTLDSF